MSQISHWQNLKTKRKTRQRKQELEKYFGIKKTTQPILQIKEESDKDNNKKTKGKEQKEEKEI